ncbi:MAG: FHA domain-containing protein [Acidobacteria bacterium]|nr:MAG: FHA domain-containing protein [Acidobacteriota bacterium]
MRRVATRVREKAKIPFSAPHVFVLATIAGPDVTASFRINGPVTIVGRDEQATIRLDDPEVSAEHCRIEVDAGICRITDLASRNGTTLNDRPVATGTWTRLKHLDEIQVGNTRLVFLAGRFRDRPRR